MMNGYINPDGTITMSLEEAREYDDSDYTKN